MNLNNFLEITFNDRSFFDKETKPLAIFSKVKYSYTCSLKILHSLSFSHPQEQRRNH